MCSVLIIICSLYQPNDKVFEREVRREKILEARHKEIKLKMKQQAAAAAAAGGTAGGGGGGEG